MDETDIQPGKVYKGLYTSLRKVTEVTRSEHGATVTYEKAVDDPDLGIYSKGRPITETMKQFLKWVREEYQ